MQRPVEAYIEAKVADDDAIKRLRDDLFSVTQPDSDFRRKDPHVTIIPPFTIDAKDIPKVDDILSESPLLGEPLPIAGVGIWPSVQNPRVVLLDVDIDLEEERERLLSKLRDLGAVDIAEPVNPHITLFKTDCGYSLSERERRDIQRMVANNRDSWETEIEYIDCTVVEHLSEPPTPSD